MLAWLLGAAIGPAAFALPVNWGADALASAAERWFRSLRRTDDLSLLVKAATGTSVGLTRAEFDAVRRLLEDRQTWVLLGHGTVEDIASEVAACLSAGAGRTAEGAHSAALVIARGLIEFAVADLDPKLFQQVLMARLQRMETDQASALDEAVLGLQANYATVIAQLKLVLDRLPPGPARRGEIVVYLKVLIDWLGADPWPTDPQFDGMVLTPAAIERKLQIIATGSVQGALLDADEAASQCRRLVILGGPGSGKTWFAKRTARRCAENALRALAAGRTLDEVELPLYTTCSTLFAAGGSIRDAVVSSTLDHLADLGGSRITAALREFLAERNAPTVLVIDSLDEARGPSDRLRQASTLPWRLVLTSRRSSWRNQLTISGTDESHRIGELQPLRYPDDVESFIRSWFAGQPERGQDLCSQISQRPVLQQSATVPLIVTFYCIVGSSGPLPELRRDLYSKVLNRMLTSRWRRDDDGQPDVDVCLSTLRDWAWCGAIASPVSGLGMWPDDIPTPRARLGEADTAAVDNVATPLGSQDIDSGKTLRRFIHRSIREHLVAEYVAGLPASEVPDVVLPHLWYDPDWERVAPAAVAMHPQHNELMRTLICRATGSSHIPADLSIVDGSWQVREFLARVASESNEDDWPADISSVIGRARVELAQSGRVSELGAARWRTSNSEVCKVLLASLPSQMTWWQAERLLGIMFQLDPSAEDRRQIRETLLALLARVTDDWSAAGLLRRVVQLAPSAEDKRQAREVLLTLLARQCEYAQTPTVGMPMMGMGGGMGMGMLSLVPINAVSLIRALVQLDPSALDKREALEALLKFLAHLPDDQQVGWTAYGRVVGMVQLALPPEDKRRARETLLGLLGRQTVGWAAPWLAWALIQLDAPEAEKRQAFEVVLALIGGTESQVVNSLVGWAANLAMTAKDRQRALEAVLGSIAEPSDHWVAKEVVAALIQLAASAAEKRRALKAVLRSLVGKADQWSTKDVVAGVIGLATSAADKQEAREVLLRSLADQTDALVVRDIAAGVLQLATSADDGRQAPDDALLELLGHETDSQAAADLVDQATQLDLSAQDKRQALDALLGLLGRETDSRAAADLVDQATRLDLSAQDKRQALDALLELLGHETDGWATASLVWALAQLDPAAQDKRQALDALLALLAQQADSQATEQVIGGIVQLAESGEDKRQARQAVLRLLATRTDKQLAEKLMGGMVQLDPTAQDLNSWRAWALPPSVELLGAARRNSPPQEWLAAVPTITATSN